MNKNEDYNYRLNSGYNPDFDIDYKLGSQGELWVHNVVKALENDRDETKTDQEFLKTGNLYIEFEAMTRAGVWKKSGISTTKAEVWVQVLSLNGVALLIAVTELRRIIDELKAHRRLYIKECKRGECPTRGYCFSAMDFWCCVRRLHLPESRRRYEPMLE